MPHPRRLRRPRPHYIVNLVLGLTVLVLFSVTGTRVANYSRAASANPYGSADYCVLENNQTVIYGWAADPDAGSLSDPAVTINAGGQAVTVPTNRAGYRDNPINAWIDQNRTGDPKPGTYGFRAVLPGLYKGSKNIITGTVLNVGPGSSVILTINDSSYVDGDANKPFFQNDMIPDACLADQPAPNTPAATPSATPAATQAPESSQSNTSKSNDADATATTGTLATTVVAQADGATILHINYGISPVKLDQSTSDQPVAPNGSATVSITGLDSSVTYSYAVVRGYPGGKTTTSSIENFTTLGYVIAVHFVDNHTEGIQGIQTVLDNGTGSGKKTSDDQGTVQFDNVSEGSHTLRYAYKGRTYSQPVNASADTTSPDEASASHVVTLNYTINIEKAAALAAQPVAHSGSPLMAIVITISALLIISALVWIVLKRRKRQNEQDAYESPPPPLPDYRPIAPTMPNIPVPPAMPQVPQQSQQPVGPVPSNASGPAPHAGESLKDLVLRSMAEEAKRKQDNQK